MGRPLQVKIPNSKFQITNKFEITITKTILRFGHFHRHDYKYLFVILSDCLGGCYNVEAPIFWHELFNEV